MPGETDNWKHRSAAMRCRTCIYFVPKLSSTQEHEMRVATVMPGGDLKDGEPSTRVLGRCRRHAPTLSGWPAVFADDWCGDHKLDENKA